MSDQVTLVQKSQEAANRLSGDDDEQSDFDEYFAKILRRLIGRHQRETTNISCVIISHVSIK